MGRVIRTESLATQRTRLMKAMALAVRELAKLGTFNGEARDLAAFLVLALDEVADTIERSVQPWEKRDFWLKADRFRMEWAWVETLRRELRETVLAEDAGEVAYHLAALGQRLKDVQVSEKHRLGTPWKGAWTQLTSGK